MGYFFDYFNNIGAQGNGYLVTRADRQPCPVCGHPTGDCAGEGSIDYVVGFDTKTNKATPMYFVEQDYWEERDITPYTRARVLVHKKGSSITRDEAVRIGLLKQD
jgi:hypothetical protein